MGNSLGILNRIATFLASARESIGSVAHQAAGRGEPAIYEDCGRPARSDSAPSCSMREIADDCANWCGLKAKPQVR